eukprot:355468-Chlamydomonas_euryale.AAC.4
MVVIPLRVGAALVGVDRGPTRRSYRRYSGCGPPPRWSARLPTLPAGRGPAAFLPGATPRLPVLGFLPLAPWADQQGACKRRCLASLPRAAYPAAALPRATMDSDEASLSDEEVVAETQQPPIALTAAPQGETARPNAPLRPAVPAPIHAVTQQQFMQRQPQQPIQQQQLTQALQRMPLQQRQQLMLQLQQQQLLMQTHQQPQHLLVQQPQQQPMQTQQQPQHLLMQQQQQLMQHSKCTLNAHAGT